MKPTAAAASGFLTNIPAQAPTCRDCPGYGRRRLHRYGDRSHRPLPIASHRQAAVLAGRVLADFLTEVVAILVLVMTGLSVGWRIHDGVGDALLAFGLCLLIAFAMTKGHPEHAADEVLMVVAPTRNLDRRAEDVDEEQNEDEGLNGHVEELRGLSDDAHDAPTRQHKRIPQRPPRLSRIQLMAFPCATVRLLALSGRVPAFCEKRPRCQEECGFHLARRCGGRSPTTDQVPGGWKRIGQKLSISAFPGCRCPKV